MTNNEQTATGVNERAN